MAWTGSEVAHCSDDSEEPECYARDERDLIAEEAVADAKCSSGSTILVTQGEGGGR